MTIYISSHTNKDIKGRQMTATPMISIWTHRLYMALAILLLSVASAFAQADTEIITITEGNVEPTPIAITNFIGPDGLPTDIGRDIAEIISNDLEG